MELRSEAAYAIYASCMYDPTFEKYLLKIEQYLSNPQTRCFGAFASGKLSGILIIQCGKILGIAVEENTRRKGIGRALINHAALYFSTLSAETDDDAVDFYRACGFECTRFERTFPDRISIRYNCIKNKF